MSKSPREGLKWGFRGVFERGKEVIILLSFTKFEYQYINKLFL